jgi:hypothetical protein
MTRNRRLDLLAGIETGVIGGVAMLVCFAVAASLLGHAWWLIPNLMAARLYHRGLLQPGVPTVVGTAWLLLGAGVGGAINGLLTSGGRLFGLAVAAAAYLICYVVVWKRAAPLMLVHAPQAVLMAGFLAYGSVLGWHPYFRRTLGD